MKKLLAVLMLVLTLGMSGCIVYEDDYYEPHRHHSAPHHVHRGAPPHRGPGHRR